MSRVLLCTVCVWMTVFLHHQPSPFLTQEKPCCVLPKVCSFTMRLLVFFILCCTASTWKHKQRLLGPALTWFPAERFRHGQGKSPCPSSLCTVSHWCMNSSFSWRFSHVAVYTQYYKVQSECYWINSEWAHLSNIWQIKDCLGSEPLPFIILVCTVLQV